MEQLEEMGAIVLGKTNLNVSETCAFVSSLVDVRDIGVLQLQVRWYSQAFLAGLIYHRGDANSNGWSAIGGQTQSAYLARKPNETGLGQSVRSIISHTTSG